jgi:hypothetical protein
MKSEETTQSVLSARRDPKSGANLAPLQGYGDIQDAIVALLQDARRAAARNVNALMTATYWEIGRRIVEFQQGGEERAEYGSELLKRLSVDLSGRFGRGFSERNLEQMRLFYLSWPISQTLSAKSPELDSLAKQFPLPWSAYGAGREVPDGFAR